MLARAFEIIAIIGAGLIGLLLAALALGAICACILSSRISRLEDANERDRLSLEG